MNTPVAVLGVMFLLFGAFLLGVIFTISHYENDEKYSDETV